MARDLVSSSFSISSRTIESNLPSRTRIRACPIMYDSSTISFIIVVASVGEVNAMVAPVHPGLLLAGLVVRAILGSVVVTAVVLFLWKIGKLADAYADKLKAK